MKNEDNFLFLHFLQAKMEKQSFIAIEHLLKICKEKINQLKSHVFSESFLLLLNPSFMIEVVKEFMQHAISIKTCNNSSVEDILKIIVSSCPALQEALFLLARLQFIDGHTDHAIINLEKLFIKTNDPGHESYLLMAQIQIQLGLYNAAAQNLEVRLIYIFT